MAFGGLAWLDHTHALKMLTDTIVSVQALDVQGDFEHLERGLSRPNSAEIRIKNNELRVLRTPGSSMHDVG
jgi:hypothetical protein